MSRIVVCDTGPLLHLSEAGAIEFLRYAGEIFIRPSSLILLPRRIHQERDHHPRAGQDADDADDADHDDGGYSLFAGFLCGLFAHGNLLFSAFTIHQLPLSDKQEMNGKR